MSKIILAEQSSAPATPAAGKVAVYVDNTATPLLKMVDDAGAVSTLLSSTRLSYNRSVASQGAGFATDTYLTGSNITFPANPTVGTIYHLVFDVSKTAASTATPIITLRTGTNATTADTARCTFTFTAQTAAVDVGTIEVWALFRTVGSGTSAVLQGRAQINHNLSVTGLVNLVNPTLQVTSAGFDSTSGNTIIGVSVNGGTSAAWTVQLVQADLTTI